MNMNIFLGSYFHDFVAFTIVGHGGPWSHKNISWKPLELLKHFLYQVLNHDYLVNQVKVDVTYRLSPSYLIYIKLR